MDDVIEIIQQNSCVIHTIETAAQALRDLPATSVRLDLHGVLDTLEPTAILPTVHSYCAISYVGSQSPIRAVARQQIQERIATAQIMFGILVFSRGKGKEKRAFFAPGGKAWIQQYLPSLGPRSFFIDNAKDHILSTKALCPHIHCLHFGFNDKLCNFIKLNISS